MTKIDATLETVAAARLPDQVKNTSLPLLASAWRAVVKITDVVSEQCRLIRAYNELTRLDARTLRDIGVRPGEIDRIFKGHPPRRFRGGR